MSPYTEKIAELYYRSGSVGFGNYRWTYHQEAPNEPDAPWYLHYPDAHQPGAKLLPDLHELIGQAFYDLCHERGINPQKIAAVPNGANPIAEAHARCYMNGVNDKLLYFSKVKREDKTTEFRGPTGEYERPDELIVDDDHVSRSLNKRLLIPVARQAGLIVKHVLTVVDHEQGAAEILAAENVALISLMTGRYLLEYGFEEGFVTADQYEEVRSFQARTYFEGNI